MTSAKFSRFWGDFVSEYHHAKFGGNWTGTNKEEMGGGGGHHSAYNFGTHQLFFGEGAIGIYMDWGYFPEIP